MNFNSPRVVAIRVSQSFQDLGKFLRKVNYFKSKKITISRKGLLNVEMQKMDMLKFLSQPYVYSKNFWILYISFLCFTLAFCLGFINNDVILRYFLYTKCPYNMKCLDDFCLWAKNKSDFIEKKYFFFLGKEEMNTPEGFNKNMKKIKNLLFKIDEKEQIAKEKFEILKKEVKAGDITLEEIDNILKENDQQILKNA